MRRRFRGGRIVDVGGGHGLLAQMLVLLDDTSPGAVVVDVALPASAATLHAALVSAWPRLFGRVSFLTASVDDIALGPDDVVVSIHACGSLTDRVLDRAATARARVAVLPCCHDLAAADARAFRVDGRRARDRHGACVAAPRAGLRHLDAGDSR